MGTKISKPAIKECISATMMVLLGNAYGRSFEAVDPAMIILRKLSRSDWIYYIEEYLTYDEEVLYKISAGDLNMIYEFILLYGDETQYSSDPT